MLASRLGQSRPHALGHTNVTYAVLVDMSMPPVTVVLVALLKRLYPSLHNSNVNKLNPRVIGALD